VGTIYGFPLMTAGLSNKATYQRFKVSESSLILAAKIGVVVYNSPSFSDLTLSIYSDRSSLPGALMYSSSNTVTSASICTLANGNKEIYFEFNPPDGVEIRGEEYYHLVLSSLTYVGDDNSHLAWKASWPDHTYSGFTPDAVNLNLAPFQVSFIGAPL
jgi:hypothetical protein